MKKKVALLLSAVMALSPITAFGASDNQLSKQPSTVVGKTLFMEEDWAGGKLVNLKVTDDETDKIEYAIDGTTLYLKPTNGNIKKGDTIKLSLDNAKWFFRHNTSDNSLPAMEILDGDDQTTALKAFIAKYGVVETLIPAVAAPGNNKITLNAAGVADGVNKQWFEQLAKNYIQPSTLSGLADAAPILVANLDEAYDHPIPISYTDFTNPKLIEKIVAETGTNPSFAEGTNEATTYDITKGIYYPNSKTYVKFNEYSTVAAAVTDVGYTITVSSSDDKIATLRFHEDYTVAQFKDLSGIPVPLVSLAEGEGDVRVQVGIGSNLTSLSTGNYRYGLAAKNNTTTSVKDKVIAKFNFPLDVIEIKEKVPYSIQQGKITITAPYGYFFADPKVKLSAEKVEDEKLPTVIASEDLFFKGNETEITNEVVTIGGNKVGRYIDYAYEVDAQGLTQFDKPLKDKIVINTHEDPFPGLPATETGLGLQHSSRTNGVLALKGLVLVAQEYASTNEDIKLNIKGDGVTEEDFVIGTRKDWGVNFDRLTDVTKLVSGRFADDKNSSEFDKDHKTARVKFSENVVASWWSLRESEFYLTEGVKFRQVKIKDEKNFSHLNTSYELEGTYKPQSERTSYISLDANTMKITDLDIKRDSVASFEMDTWVSVEPGWEGDIMLQAGGNEILAETKPVKIAYAVSPITVSTVVKDVKIGYQWQKVSDFTIQETEPSMLKRNTEVEIFMDDNITGSDSIAFAPDFITEINTDSKILFSKPIISSGSITFNIERNSNEKPATIKFSNVYVKIDRTVPESNRRPYQIVVGGTAVAANHSTKPGIYEPKFIKKGIGSDYLNVVTSANDKDSVLSNIVRVSIDSNEVLIGRDGTSDTVYMDTAAYISAESNSTMVPVRFVSQALGIPDNQISWDNEARTVTIYNGARIIQFAIDSSDITINGVTTTMYSADTQPLKVKAEVRDDRAFLPFRALGNALGVSVDWDVETQMAIYNIDVLDGYTDRLEAENLDTTTQDDK